MTATAVPGSRLKRSLDRSREKRAHAETGERQGVKGYGHEADTYRKGDDGEGRIASWVLHDIRFDPLYPQPLPEHVSGGPELMREDEFVSAIGD